jgi:hypothetical protein
VRKAIFLASAFMAEYYFILGEGSRHERLATRRFTSVRLPTGAALRATGSQHRTRIDFSELGVRVRTDVRTGSVYAEECHSRLFGALALFFLLVNGRERSDCLHNGG